MKNPPQNFASQASGQVADTAILVQYKARFTPPFIVQKEIWRISIGNHLYFPLCERLGCLLGLPVTLGVGCAILGCELTSY